MLEYCEKQVRSVVLESILHCSEKQVVEKPPQRITLTMRVPGYLPYLGIQTLASGTGDIQLVLGLSKRE